MHWKLKLYRTGAKHRAAGYAGKRKRYGVGNGRRPALVMLLASVGFLYIKDLPLLRFPRTGYELIERLASEENRKTREEEVFTIQYASVPGGYLSVSEADGDIPAYVPPERIPESIGVKEILEERFGDLTTVPFRNFLTNYYIEDSSTKATEDVIRLTELAEYELSVEKKEEPQILIFHTHTSEGYLDSRPGVAEDTVVGAGALLAEELRTAYGYNVIHETTVFDRTADGSDDRNNAYNNALPVITAILEKYPSIEVVIDLHRDSGDARTSVINGVSTAKVMLFNGLCRTKDGPITYYSNPNLTGNLAFSLHLQITGNELYPGLMHRIYLKSYRYNMHLKEKYLLVELGTHKNTVAEAKAAMVPFAETIATVLSGK